MTPFENFLENLVTLSPWGLVKFGILIFLTVYIIFAVIIVRQVQLMVKTLNGSFNLPLQTLAYLHLGFAIFVFLLAMITL